MLAVLFVDLDRRFCSSGLFGALRRSLWSAAGSVGGGGPPPPPSPPPLRRARRLDLADEFGCNCSFFLPEEVGLLDAGAFEVDVGGGGNGGWGELVHVPDGRCELNRAAAARPADSLARREVNRQQLAKRL